MNWEKKNWKNVANLANVSMSEKALILIDKTHRRVGIEKKNVSEVLSRYLEIWYQNRRICNLLKNQMDNKYKAIVLLLLVASCTSTSQGCKDRNGESLIQTGVVIFGQADQGDREYCESVLINYNIPVTGFQSAVAILNLNNFIINQNVDFSVRGHQKHRTSELSITLLIDSGRWVNLKVSYIATSRHDIFVGSFIGDTFETLACDNQNDGLAQVTSVVPGFKHRADASLTIVAYISGVRTANRYLNQLLIQESAINAFTGALTITLKTQARDKIEEVHISYLIILGGSGLVHGYGDSETGNHHHLFSGISEIIGTKSVERYYWISFSVYDCVGDTCPGNCVDPSICDQLKGTIFESYCYICAANEKFINGRCQSQCGDHEWFHNGGCHCIKGYWRDSDICINTCPIGQVRVNGRCQSQCGDNEWFHNGACDCVTGFWRDSDICINTCGRGKVRVNGQCVCDANYILRGDRCLRCPPNAVSSSDGTKCYCKKDHVWNRYTRRCELTDCPINSQAVIESSGIRCVCHKGYYLSNGVCEKIEACPIGAEYDTQTHRCVCTRPDQYMIHGSCRRCGDNTIFNGQECQCKDGYFNNNGKCVYPSCPENSIAVVAPGGYTCECINGYYKDGAICRHIDQCPAQSRYDQSTHRCVCIQADQYIINGACVGCGDNAIFDGQECRCKDGYFNSNRRCVYPTCPVNSVAVVAPGGYTCECINGYYKDGTICRHIETCPPQSRYDQATHRCVCVQQGYYIINGVCIGCGQNTVFNGQECQCKDGYFNSNGRCISPICPKNSVPVTAPGGYTCQCNRGYYKDKTICRPIEHCPPQSTYDQSTHRCICIQPNYYPINGLCRSCGIDEVFDGSACTCREGFIRVGPICSKICGINEELVNGVCVCKFTYVKIRGVCRSCPENSLPNNEGTKCICIDNFIWSDFHRKCEGFTCPAYSAPVVSPSGQITCECYEGYYKHQGQCKQKTDCPAGTIFSLTLYRCVCPIPNQYLINGRCVSCPSNSAFQDDKCTCDPRYIWSDYSDKCQPYNCPSNSHPVIAHTGVECSCDQGYYKNGAECVHVVECPTGASWNDHKLTCICTGRGQHMINNHCGTCADNQGWNGDECVCRTGFFNINGVCRECDPNTSYNGRDCICNFGFYGDRDQCRKCHSTCGKCYGPLANQCTKCVDVSYTLENSVCKRELPCPVGYYHENSICKACSSFCSDCKSETVCDTCIDGFEKSVQHLEGIGSIEFCVEKCGDGKRFELDCDDGNYANGDGCSKDCKVEKGFICSGGSSVKASTCVEQETSRSLIVLTGSVHMFGRVVQGVRMTHIPKALTDNDCPQCHKLLLIRVIMSNIVPGVRVNYLPKSKYQFLAEFEFHGATAIPIFTFTVQINPEFAKYFSEEDLAQIEIRTIDPALLAKADEIEELDIGDIDHNAITISRDAVDSIFEEEEGH